MISSSVIGLETIPLIAKKLSTPYDDNTSQSLAKSIDKINQAFSTYVTRNILHHIISIEGSISSSAIPTIDNSMVLTIWNCSFSVLIPRLTKTSTTGTWTYQKLISWFVEACWDITPAATAAGLLRRYLSKLDTETSGGA